MASVPVTETFEGQTVWDGDAQVFELIDCPESDCAYAWSCETEGGRRRFFVVLRKPLVDSPQKAVEASIAAGYKNSG